MRKTRFGMRLSRIGLGAVKWGRVKGLKYPSHEILPEFENVASLVEMGRRLGLNWIDTAVAYGEANLRIGQLELGKDPYWKICLKLGERFDGENSEYDFQEAALRQDFDRALEQLQTEQVDVTLLHLPSGPGEVRAYESGQEALRSMKSRGITKAIGASTHSVEVTARALADMDVAMVELSRAHRKLESIVRGAPAGSILVKKPFSNGWLVPPFGDVSVIDALAYCFGPPSVAAVAVGTISPEHLSQCVGATTEFQPDQFYTKLQKA